jgi:hypothetical protein
VEEVLAETVENLSIAPRTSFPDVNQVEQVAAAKSDLKR